MSRIDLSPAMLLLCLLFTGARPAAAATGVLLPRDEQTPDPKVLSLEEMTVRVEIDNDDAHVIITQTFLNHTAGIQEGTYRFPLPGGSTISDFAVWDGAVRIPAVVLERRRAEEVYRNARLQAVDPGLLEAGEREGGTPEETALFTAKIVPIAAYGTKRLEIEYHQHIETTAFAAGFVLPLKPDAGGQESVGKFHASVLLHSAQTMTGARMNTGYTYRTTQSNAHSFSAELDASSLRLTEDLGLRWQLQQGAGDTLAVIAHRDPTPAAPQPDEKSPSPATAEPGFFQATLLAGEPAATQATAPPRTVILLFDTSLSMQWDKLERSYAAAASLLQTLHSDDGFNLLLFNDRVVSFSPAPVAADAAGIAAAMTFLRASHLRGGTDMAKALAAGLSQCAGLERAADLVVLSDGNADAGESVLPGKIAAAYTKQWKALAPRPHTDIFAVGDDADLGLLRLLAQNDGVLEQVLSTEPLDLHLKNFLAKLSSTPLAGLTLQTNPGQAISLVYPLQETTFSGSTASWVGQYARPGEVAFKVHGTRKGEALEANATANLPAQELAHPQLPRLWAQARVQALLEGIDRDGETTSAIDEIIRLARRYKLVTPYTSFLAVPRSLLRPRVIRPGDPVLRVRTDPAIRSVVAIFPFGLTKPLRHLAEEDVPDRRGPRGTEGGLLWETRFLAPAGMSDGTYAVRLILRDAAGAVYREGKSFVIASTPPALKILLPQRRVHRGETVTLRVAASSTTRTLTARLENGFPLNLRWNPAAAANTGLLIIPTDGPLGPATLIVTAEDVAHNLGTAEVTVDVAP